jgi:hypothetical protein
MRDGKIVIMQSFALAYQSHPVMALRICHTYANFTVTSADEQSSLPLRAHNILIPDHKIDGVVSKQI